MQKDVIKQLVKEMHQRGIIYYSSTKSLYFSSGFDKEDILKLVFVYEFWGTKHANHLKQSQMLAIDELVGSIAFNNIDIRSRYRYNAL